MAGKERSHTAASGEDLFTIARQYGVAIEHFAFANGLPVGLEVAPGKKLVVPTRRVLPANPPENGLVINLPERGVFLFRKGQFEKFYPVAIGSPGRFATPEGNFKLESRVENPTWLPPEWAGLGEVSVPAGPDNPLGDRWMGLSMPGVGLHSTTQPSSIGAAVSHGCMRMYPESARELFDKVTVGMPVRIEYEPIKVGYDQETGEVCLVIYQDVYGRYDMTEEARRVLKYAGISQWVDDKLLQRLLSRHSGRPEQAVITAVDITVSGQTMDTPLAGVVKDGSLWVNSDVVRSVGLQLAYDQATKSVQVAHGEVQIHFPVSNDAVPAEQGPVAYMFNGRTLLPARPLLNQFGIPFRWEPATRTLHIEATLQSSVRRRSASRR
ncbi:MAG: L,D-transpeptidase family protein [Candidatus Eremiobacterota bacterium]